MGPSRTAFERTVLECKVGRRQGFDPCLGLDVLSSRVQRKKVRSARLSLRPRKASGTHHLPPFPRPTHPPVPCSVGGCHMGNRNPTLCHHFWFPSFTWQQAHRARKCCLLIVQANTFPKFIYAAGSKCQMCPVYAGFTDLLLSSMFPLSPYRPSPYRQPCRGGTRRRI